LTEKSVFSFKIPQELEWNLGMKKSDHYGHIKENERGKHETRYFICFFSLY